MINENKKLMKTQIRKEKTLIYEKIFEFFDKVYELNYYIIESKNINLWWYCMSLVIEYLQIIMFILDETLSNIWKQPILVEKIHNILKYLFIFPLFKVDHIIYLIIINFIMAFIILFFISFIITIFINKKNLQKNKNILVVYRFIIELISFTFFGQIFFGIITIFFCVNGDKTYFDQNMKCKTGIWYNVDSILGVISLIILILMSFFFASTFFIPNFVNNNIINNSLKKSNNCIDKSFLINKILITLIFYINQILKFEWEIIIILLISTGIHLYIVYYFRSYEEKNLLLIHKLFSFILFWGFVSITVGKIFGNWGFNGGLYLFFSGVIVMTFCYFCKAKNDEIMDIYNIDFYNIDSCEERLYYIQKYLYLLENKNKDRASGVIFQSLIDYKEESCISSNCKLKQYLHLSSKGYESNYLLLQHCEKLFEISAILFPKNVLFKCNYIIFLVIYLNKKILAESLLHTLNQKLIHFQDNYIIFYCKKYIKKCFASLTKNNEAQINKNILNYIQYKNLFNQFLEQLSNISSLYLQFWSSLLNYHLQGTENLAKLNELASKIKDIIEKINSNYERLHRVKADDLRVVKLYYIFVKDILNDKIKSNDIKKMLTHFSKKVKIDDREIDYKNFDLRILSENDEYKYLLLSADEKSIGKIIEISLNSCKIFGYTKNEVIGKSINLLIPSIYHKKHSKMLFEYIINHKNTFYESLFLKKEYDPDISEKYTYGINKAKYLVPLYVKSYLVQTEESDIVLIVELSNEEDILNKNRKIPLHEDSTETKIIKNSGDYCCVLTDKNFMIQEFTPNSVEFLGLNSSAIDANYFIINYIKEFNEDISNSFYLSNNLENNIDGNEITGYQDNSDINGNSSPKTNTEIIESVVNLPIAQKIQIAKKIVNERFNHPRRIVWKYSIFSEMMKVNNISQKLKNPKNINARKKSTGSVKLLNDKKLILEIIPSLISGKIVGYKFYFKNINYINNYENGFLEKSPNGRKFNNHSKKKVKFNEDEIEKLNKKKTNQEEKNVLIKIEESINDNADIMEMIGTNIERVQTKSMFTKDIIKEEPKIQYALSAKRLKTNEKFLINENYVPETEFNFDLNVNNMTYFGLQKIKSSEKKNDSLRNLAFDKIRFHEEENKKNDENVIFSSFLDNSESGSSYYSESNYSNSNDYYSSSVKNSIRKMGNLKNTEIKQKKKETKKIEIPIFNKENNNEISGEYYKIKNINKIRFMYFDFDKEMIVENEKIEKKSEIETVIFDYKLKLLNNFGKDDNYPNINLSNFQIKKNKDGSNIKSSNENEGSSLNSSRKGQIRVSISSDKENELLKYIGDALIKNDKEKTIMIFSFISSLTVVFIALSTIICFYFILSTLKRSKQIIHLISRSANIRYNLSIGIYYIRELVLLNMNNNVKGGNYINPPAKNLTKYKQYLGTIIQDLYHNFHEDLEKNFEEEFIFYNKTDEALNSVPYTSTIFYENLNSRIIVTNLISAMTRVDAAFYVISMTPNYLTQTLEDFLNFMYNSLNNVGKGFGVLLDVFMANLYYGIYKNKIFMISFFIILLILFIILYIIMSKGYLNIIKRKDSLISVFYGIGLSLIKSSIKKCENFNKIINKNSTIINKSNEESQQDDESNSENSHLVDNNNIDEIIGVGKKTQIVKNMKKSTNINKFKIIIAICFSVSYLFLLLIIIIYFNCLNMTTNYGEYAFHMQRLHINILNLYNCFREYLYDNNSIMYGENTLDSIKNFSNELYLTKTDDISILNTESIKIKGLPIKYKELISTKLCLFKTDFYFDSVEECDKLMNNITSLGFYNLISFFIEEIRIKSNLAKNYLDQDLIVGNLTKAGYEVWTNESLGLSENSIKMFRMELFNNNIIHSKINILFSNIILPFIEKQKDIILFEISIALNSVDTFYIIIFSVYFILLFCCVIFYWIPKIQTIKDIVYKTKNMLTIIPKQILSLQSSIKSLLNIPEDI